MDGQEVFFQPDKSGPCMLTITQGNMRCFLWRVGDSQARYFLREWSEIATAAPICEFASVEDIVTRLTGGAPGSKRLG